MITGILIFTICYIITITYTSIFYHRALAHNALTLPKYMIKFIEKTGMYVTGIDPLAWICMHRMHHIHSDTKEDPHSPCHTGFWYTFVKQHKSFERTLIRLIRRDKKFTGIVKDIPFKIHWLNRRGLWYLPFVAHMVIGLLLGLVTKNVFIGCGYFFGMCSHPIQGFMVNSFGHAVGYRNFDHPDNSRNNTLVAWLVFGEGYQNNHHQYPNSPKFSVRNFEIDFGYLMVKFLALFGIVKIKYKNIAKWKKDTKALA